MWLYLPKKFVPSSAELADSMKQSDWQPQESKTVVYVERESYAVATLCKKMEDKILDEAPVWSDITSFDGRAWRGKVSCLIGGFPCTDLSSQAKRRHRQRQPVRPLLRIRPPY